MAGSLFLNLSVVVVCPWPSRVLKYTLGLEQFINSGEVAGLSVTIHIFKSQEHGQKYNIDFT